MRCPKCGSVILVCPNCEKKFKMGEATKCDVPACVAMNSPLDCIGCSLTVALNNSGVLTFDGDLIPFR